jgi:hypothetical protein
MVNTQTKGSTMFSEKDEIRIAAEQLWEVAQNYGRGEIIPWSVVESATAMKYGTTVFKTTVNKFKKRLLKDREIANRPERGTGIRLLTATEQIHCPGRRERAGRQLYRGAKEVKAVDASSLTDHDRRFQYEQIKSLRSERSAVRAGEKSVVGRVESIERQPMPVT